MTELMVGDLVRSSAGRDAGRLLFVVGFDGARVLLADGKVRPADRPKLKKPRHVQFVSRPEGRCPEKLRCGEKITNSELRKTIAALSGEPGAAQSGGSA